MTDESGVGEVSDIFTDVQPRNRTETDTEVSSDVLESLTEAVFIYFIFFVRGGWRWSHSASWLNVFI